MKNKKENWLQQSIKCSCALCEHTPFMQTVSGHKKNNNGNKKNDIT